MAFVSSRRSLGAVLGVVLAIVIATLPSIGQLNVAGQRALAIVAMTVVFWAADVLNPAITALLALGLLLAIGVPAGVALSGYSTSAFWILVSVLFFGHAMDKTGLARRIWYQILLTGRASYGGILFSFFLIGFILTLGVPSMTVRTAMMVPVAWALVKALGLELPGRGAALIILTTFEMAVLPGCAFLTGSLWGPFIAGLFTTVHASLTWFEYARMMAIPTVLWCLLVLGGNMLVLKPEAGTVITKTGVRDELAKLGAMGRGELVTASIVVLSIAAWASQPWHRVPAEAIGLLAMTMLFATGVLAPPDIGTGIPWGLALLIGGMLCITSVITTYKISAWLGGFIVPAVQPFLNNPLQFVLAVAAAVVTMRFVDPIGFITIAAFFLPLAMLPDGPRVPLLVLVGAILMPVHVFWFNYQNFWVAMTEGITNRLAFTDGHRLRLATVFLAVTIIALGLSVAYWRLIGAL